MDRHSEKTECTFSIFSENSPGVLHRVIALFTRRKINIESLTVSHTETEGVSRFTIVVNCRLELAHLVGRQLRRIVEVLKVKVSENSQLIYKEIAFFRIGTPDARARQFAASHAVRHGASIVSIDAEALVIEKTGTEEEIQELFSSFKTAPILEFIRSGRIAVRKQLIEEDEVTQSFGAADSADVIM